MTTPWTTPTITALAAAQDAMSGGGWEPSESQYSSPSGLPN